MRPAMNDASKDRKRRKPHLVTLSTADAEAGDEAASPQDAPPPPDLAQAALDGPQGETLSRPPRSVWPRLFWASVATLLSAAAALWIYDLVADLFARHAWLGSAAFAVAGLAIVALLVLAAREAAALSRLGQIADLRRRAEGALAAEDGRAAARAAEAVAALYRGRPEFGRDPAFWRRLADRAGDAPDADRRLELYEAELFPALDAEARAAVAQAARRVAATTALMPSALLDAAAALYLNMAMLRRIAEIYGGRAGYAATWRLARRVVAQAMAAGLIALGDDLLEPLIGGGLASKISRRAGEGVVNGALTARIGAAAMEVCRPLPFDALPKPRLRDLAWEALKGVRSKP